MATIYDVARRAEVSPATVSRVVNGHANVDAALVERVRLAMRELDYRPNAVARNLRRSRTTLWAVIIADIGNPFFTAMVRGVEDVAHAEGFSVVLCNTDEDPAKEGRYVNASLAEQMAGVIISPSGRTPHIHRLVDARVPVVVIDRQLRGIKIDTVLVDNELGSQAATAHLIEAGYQRIACITGPRNIFTATQRLRGYRQALEEHGLALDYSLIRYSDFREEGGYQAMASLLATGTPPEAIFTTNNLMTLGAMRCIVDNGLSVPSDIGIVGFDDLPWTHLVRPSLTTVAQPTYELGRAAAQLLAARIAEPGRTPTTITLATKLNIRDSSARK